jgi:hypothetical protein
MMAEIEWPLEEDAGSSWHLIVAYAAEGRGSSPGELTQSVELLRRLAEALALRSNFSSPRFASAKASVPLCFLSGKRCRRIGGGGRCSRGGNEFALRE